jgi:hypothetical protein
LELFYCESLHFYVVQIFQRDIFITEGGFFCADDLIIFVTFAGNKNNVVPADFNNRTALQMPMADRNLLQMDQAIPANQKHLDSTSSPQVLATPRMQ